MSITVPTKHLKAALLAAGKKDIRYYLNGVLIESVPAGTRCVATTGSIAAVLRSTPEGLNELGAFVCPREVVEAAVKMKREHTVFERIDADHWMMNDTHRFKQVDGTFPSYRRIMKRVVSGLVPTCGFDPELFAVFGKIAAALGASSLDVSTHLDGQSAAAITIEGHPEFAGVISPLNLTKNRTQIGVQGWACDE